MYSSDHKYFIPAFTPCVVAKFKPDANVKVYDFSVQIRKIQTGDTAGAAEEPAAAPASSASSSSSHHHRHRSHHRDESDRGGDKAERKSSSDASSSKLKPRDSGSLSRSKSGRHTESTSPPPPADAPAADRGLRRHKSSYAVAESKSRSSSSSKSGRHSPSVSTGTPGAAAVAAAAAAAVPVKASPVKPAPPPGAPPGKTRSSSLAVSQPGTPAAPMPTKANSASKSALVNSDEKTRLSSSSPMANTGDKSPGDKSRQLSSSPPAPADREDGRSPSPVAPAPAPATRAPAPTTPAPAPAPATVTAVEPPATTSSRTSSTATSTPTPTPTSAVATAREPPLRGQETSALNESTIRRLRDRQAEASGRLSLLEQWHSGKPKDAQVLEEMTRLGIELADISATLSGEKSVEEFNKDRMAAAVVRKPTATDAVAPKKENLSDSKKAAKDKKGRSETAPASTIAVAAGADNATASTSATAATAAPAAAAAAAVVTAAAPAAVAPAAAAPPAAATSGEPRRSKTLLPKSLQQPKLPEDHAEVAKKLRDILDKPWDQVLVFKDTYRLARRFQVYDGGKRVIDGSSLSLADQSPIKTFCRVVQCIADRLETPARAAVINKACNAIVETESDAPPDLLIRQLFEQSIGLNSRTAAVFRPVHQGVIMPVTFWLKSKTRLLSKDVATADGWRLLIEFERLACEDDAPADTARDVDGRRVSVTITHYRKEQSLVTELDERFVVEYRLRFRLAPNLLQTSEFDIKFTLVDVDRQRAYPDILQALLPLEQWNKTTPLLKLYEPGPRGREAFGQLVCIRPDQDGPVDAAAGAAAVTTAATTPAATAPTRSAAASASASAAPPEPTDDASRSGSRSSSVYSSEDDDDEAAPPPPEPVEDAALRMSVMAQVVSTGGHLSPSQSTHGNVGGGGKSAAAGVDGDDDDESRDEDDSPSVSYSDESPPPPSPPPNKVIVEPLAGVVDDDDDDDDDFIGDESTYSTESGED